MTVRPPLALLIALTLAGSVSGLRAQDVAPAPAASAPAPAKSSLPLAATDNEKDAAQLSARFLTRFHYDAQPLDDAMSARIYKKYLDQLDGEKVFFTQADLARFAPLKTKLDDAIWNKDLTGPFSIFNLYVQRATERMHYALDLLDKGFDFTKDESYVIDRDKVDWPKDQAELDNLWRLRTKNDWLRLKLAGKNDADIRKTLTKRYKTLLDRIKQLDGEDAFQSFMTAYAETTDPHTDYLGPRLAENFDISMKLSLEGIGAVLQARDEYTQIREIVPGGPASKSGKLHVGDRIVAIGQDNGPMVDVIVWRLDDVVNKIRGKKDTTVRIEILPADAGPDGKHELITLVRKKVVVEEQAAKSKVIDVKDGDVSRKIGVIELPTFYADFAARAKGDPNYKSATRDVAKLLAQLKADGVQGVIMDLRNNGGGALDEASELTGLFIDKGPVVQVRKANGDVESEGDDNPGLDLVGGVDVQRPVFTSAGT